MIIDCHTHLFVKEFQNESAVSPTWDPSRDKSEKVEEAAKAYTDSESELLDPDGSEHIKRMDEAGIDKSVILHLDYGLLFGEGDMSIEAQNKYVSDVVGNYPDRLIWFCGIDPRRSNSLELLDTCVNEWGASGIKMYPTTGFLPADKAAYPFYERAAEWKIPVMFHMGPEDPPFHNEGNAHPATLLKVLVDFPELTVISAHLAFDYWRDLIALGKVTDNILCDFSAWQDIAKVRYPTFCHVLRMFLDEFGADRVMFGTDAPILEESVSSREWVEMIRNLPRDATTERSFTEDEIEALFSGNACRMLDLAPGE